MYKKRVSRILLIGIMVATSFFSWSENALAADPSLTGGSAVTSYSGIAQAITDLQITGTGNPTVPVKLRVTSGSLTMSTTSGLTFTGGSTGSTLQFSGTLSNVNAALATLTYTRSGTGTDTLEASLVNAGEVFFEDTGHLYEYVSYTGTWTQAKSQAEGRTKYGAAGYLTTITSSNENAFVAARLANAGWMGASDAATEGDWKWVTGPETGDSFWSGAVGGSAVGGRYQNWGSGEPNDYQNGVPGEDCAQFLSGGTGKWNDLPCTGTTLPGYVVEYGSSGSPIDISSLNVSITTQATDTTAPTITNISSDKTNGSYRVGEVIDIDVTFSEIVTSTGNVTVTLETGATDRTCTFTVTSSTTGTCNYTVQAGDISSDLTVNSIAGTIRDAFNNTMTNFVPATNLAANKALVIDTTAPTITNISSDKTNGSYRVGEVIDIDVTFSEIVTSTGNVTVTLETGATDRTCTFTVTSSTTGTCNYTVQAGDISSDLTVNSIAGTIADRAGNSMSSFTPSTNLAANKALVIDNAAPTVGNLAPTDGGADFSVNGNLVITFSEPVVRQTGSVVIRRSDNNAIVETISITSGQVTGSGTSTITINPNVTLESETEYYIEIQADNFDDVAGNSYAGITNPTTWNFVTEDTIAPTSTTLSPLDEVTDVELISNFLITFDEEVTFGTGNIILKKTSDDSIVETIDINSGKVTGSGSNTLTINPTLTLDYDTGYYILIDNGAVIDVSPNDNAFAGITDKTTWNFTTREKPNEVTELDITNVEYEVTTDSITVTWTTDHDADSRVRYGMDRNLKKSEDESKREEKHSMVLRNLTPGTVYYFRVSSEDKYGNEDHSRVYSVTTKTNGTSQTTSSIATVSLDTKPSIPVYQELQVETKDPVVPKTKPQASTSSNDSEKKSGDSDNNDSKKSEPQGEKEYVTSVTKKDDQQYIKEVKFVILDENRNPIPNLPVTLHSDPRTGVTDDKGMVTFTDVPTGEHHILFAYDDKNIEKAVSINDVKNPSGEVKAQVIEVMAVRDPAPLWSWIVIIILTLALLISWWFFFWKRRKKKDEEEKNQQK